MFSSYFSVAFYFNCFHFQGAADLEKCRSEENRHFKLLHNFTSTYITSFYIYIELSYKIQKCLVEISTSRWIFVKIEVLNNEYHRIYDTLKPKWTYSLRRRVATVRKSRRTSPHINVLLYTIYTIHTIYRRKIPDELSWGRVRRVQCVRVVLDSGGRQQELAWAGSCTNEFMIIPNARAHGREHRATTISPHTTHTTYNIHTCIWHVRETAQAINAHAIGPRHQAAATAAANSQRIAIAKRRRVPSVYIASQRTFHAKECVCMYVDFKLYGMCHMRTQRSRKDVICPQTRAPRDARRCCWAAALLAGCLGACIVPLHIKCICIYVYLSNAWTWGEQDAPRFRDGSRRDETPRWLPSPRQHDGRVVVVVVVIYCAAIISFVSIYVNYAREWWAFGGRAAKNTHAPDRKHAIDVLPMPTNMPIHACTQNGRELK